MILRCLFLIWVGAAAFPHTCWGAEGTRTFDRMTPDELDRISRVTQTYYMCVSDKLDSVRGADSSSPDRIIATYSPYIRILRQQCRISLLQVEKELYALGLNPEFITNYVTTLRDDVVSFALQRLLKKAANAEADSGTKRDEAARSKNDAAKSLGFDLFSRPQKRDKGTAP